MCLIAAWKMCHAQAASNRMLSPYMRVRAGASRPGGFDAWVHSAGIIGLCIKVWKEHAMRGVVELVAAGLASCCFVSADNMACAWWQRHIP